MTSSTEVITVEIEAPRKMKRNIQLCISEEERVIWKIRMSWKMKELCFKISTLIRDKGKVKRQACHCCFTPAGIDDCQSGWNKAECNHQHMGGYREAAAKIIDEKKKKGG